MKQDAEDEEVTQGMSVSVEDKVFRYLVGQLGRQWTRMELEALSNLLNRAMSCVS